MTTVLRDVWKLRANPFFPAVDASGQPLNAEALRATLDPRIDKRVIDEYFDVYDWNASTIIRDVSGPLRFPSEASFKNAIFVLISGLGGQSGRESMSNLVLHRIQSMVQQPPILVDVELQGRDMGANLSAVAFHILLRLRHGDEVLPDKDKVVAALEKEFERAEKQEANAANPTYANCFAAFGMILRPLRRHIILRITDGGDHDSWVQIYLSAKQCCSWVMVMSTDPVFPGACYNALPKNKAIAWIRAEPLNRAKAEAYVRARLAAHRLDAATDPLFPFTPATIDFLYAKGHESESAEELVHSIGVLRATLNVALEEELEALELKLASAMQTGHGFEPSKAIITPARIQSARTKINAGDA